MRVPHWTILLVTLGAFLLPLMGGHMSLDAEFIQPGDSIAAAILGGADLPLLSHFLLSLLFFIPFAYTLFTRKISSVVNVRISFWLAIFAACIGVSITVSSFPATSLVAILDWTMMSLAFFAVTICCGRRQSTFPILAFIAGTTIAALMGIREYDGMRAMDPGYRIFALQINPNQAGALFAATTILALTMALRFDRIPRLLLVLASVMMGFAMVLTQSKGAMLCFPIGLITVFVGALSLKAAKPGTIVATFILPLALTGLIAFGAQKAATSPTGSSVMSRVTNSGGEAAQSAGFRKLLWMSAIDLTKQHPYGWGLGTYSYESTRSGRVTQTKLAHQTFLQLASEASPIAPIALFGFFGSVVFWGLRGVKSLPSDTKLFLIGLLGSLAVAIAHNFIDSDMYVFSLGSFVFLLCGGFTATSVDSQAPEFIFTLPKVAFAFTAAILLPLGISASMGEMQRALARGCVREGDKPGIIDHANAALSVGFADGQAYALRALANRNEDDLVAATRFHPSPKTFRALADYYFDNQKYEEGFRSLNRALERDPANASALEKYINAADRSGNIDLAVEKAKQLVDTEKLTYFTVRSQPELVPTQTFAARLYLAKHSTNNADKMSYLYGAVKGYAQYRELTVPVVMRTIKIDPKVIVAGEDKTTIATNMQLAKSACSEIRALHRLGVPLPDGFDPEAEEGLFAKVFDELNK